MIRRSQKVYRENHEKLESGTKSRRKNLSWGENPEFYLPESCWKILEEDAIKQVEMKEKNLKKNISEELGNYFKSNNITEI